MRPFLRVQVEDFGSIGAGHSHKLVLVHLPSDLRRTTHTRVRKQVKKSKGGTLLSNKETLGY